MWRLDNTHSHCDRKTSQKMSQKTSQQILTENVIENLPKNVTSQFWKIIPRPLGPGYLVAKTVMWRFVWRKICEKSCDIFLWRGITKNVTKNLSVQRTYFDDLGSIHCVRKTSQKMSQKTSQQILTENVIENLTKNVTSQFWKIIPRPLVYKWKKFEPYYFLVA